MVENSEDKVWMFGFGSNMDIENAVKVKKGIPVSDHVGAICKGYKMLFNMGPAKTYCEPWFANAGKGSETDEIHGVTFCTNQEGMKKLDDQERGYEKITVTLDAYDGRTLQAFMYFKEKEGGGGNPSSRYLNVLIKGAKDANLKADYIERLQNHPVYTADEKVIGNRSLIPDFASLPKMTYEELAALPKDENSAHTAIFGYIMKFDAPKTIGFKAHKGRDVTRRQLRHFLGQPLDEDDDLGHPPFMTQKEMTEEQRAYVWTWFDFYFQHKAECDTSVFVGFIEGYPTV